MLYAPAYYHWVGMARAGKELLKRLTAPEIREIVREELAAALRPVEVKIEEMDKRLTNQITSEVGGLRREIAEMDKRLTGEIREMDKRISGEIAGLRRELEYAPKVALLESRVAQLEKKLEAT